MMYLISAWVWIGEVADDYSGIRPLFVCGHEEGYIAEATGLSGKRVFESCPCRSALRNQSAYVVNDISAAPDFGPWRDAALQRDYRSMLSVPLLTAGNLVLNLYSSSPLYFTKERIRAIETFANHAASVINQKTAQEQLKVANMELQAQIKAVGSMEKEWKNTFDSISDMIYIADRNYKIVRANLAFAEYIGSPAEELTGKNCYELLHCTEKPIPECPHTVAIEQNRVTTIEVAGKSCQRCGGTGNIMKPTTMDERRGKIGRAINKYTAIQQGRKYMPVGGAWVPSDLDGKLGVKQTVMLRRSAAPPCSECMGLGRVDCSKCNGMGEIKCTASGCINGIVESIDEGGLIKNKVKVKKKSKCRTCTGTGFVTCLSCRGKGNMVCKKCNSSGERQACTRCGGQGFTECRRCRGSGKTEKEAVCSECRGEGVELCSSCGGDGKKK